MVAVGAGPGRRAVRVLLVAVVTVTAAWLGRLGHEGALLSLAARDPVRATLYFATRDATGLVPLTIWLPAERWNPRGIVERLAAGPGPGEDELVPTLPPGTRLRGFRREGPRLVVDLSGEVQREHWGGSAGEILTVYSLVNSLAELPGVEEVLILVEGRRLDSLVGHLDLSLPLRPDPTLVARPGATGSYMHPPAGAE